MARQTKVTESEAAKMAAYRSLGYSQTEIADKLNRSEATVHKYQKQYHARAENIGGMEAFGELVEQLLNVTVEVRE